jgi:SAM-dependent methyltransferase
MSHFQQQEFLRSVRTLFPEYFSTRHVLEVGSWDVNGSIREFFSGCDYLGVDVAMGKGVDLVCSGECLDLPTASFDTVASCNCFEHNPLWLETFVNMWRMLKPGGLCMVSCATVGFREHGTSRTTPGESLTSEMRLPDYYRNLTRRDFERSLDMSRLFSHYRFFENVFSRDLYFVGIKAASAPADAATRERLDALAEKLRGITTEQGATMGERLLRMTGQIVRHSLVPLVGQQNYLDAQFLASSVKRRLLRR